MLALDGRREILDEVRVGGPDAREYLEDEMGVLLGPAGFLDTLHWHFPGDAQSQVRVPDVIARLRRIAGS